MDNEREKITRAEAQAKGLKRYFTGEPCKNGHVAEWSTNQGKCLQCIRERGKRYHKKLTTERRNEYLERRPQAYKTNRKAVDKRNANPVRRAKHLAQQNQFYQIHKEERSIQGREKHRADPRLELLAKAKDRAKKLGRECDIELTDIILVDNCPLTGRKLEIGTRKSHSNSPTLDRIDNTRGYVKGNVAVVSHVANSAKKNLLLEELVMMGKWAEQEITKRLQIK
jgi:ribosomal protein L28